MQLEFLEPNVTCSMNPTSSGSLRALQADRDRFAQEGSACTRVLRAVEAYSARIESWESAARPLGLKQKIPSLTTLSLLALGGVLAIGVNAVVLGHQLALQQLVLANLGSVVVLILAGISLSFDRTLRGYGQELLLREAGNRASEIAQQLRSLVLSREELHQEVDGGKRELGDLRSQIASSQEQANAYEAKLAHLRQQLMDETSRLSRCQHSVANLQAEQQELELSVQAHSDRLFEVAERHENLTEEIAGLERTRNSLHNALETEQAEFAAKLESLQDELDARSEQRDDANKELDALYAQIKAVRDDRSELQCELELIREEFERNTVANIQSLTKLRGEVQELQVERNSLQEFVSGIQSEAERLTSVKDSLELRIEDCRRVREALEAELVRLHEQICDDQHTHESLESSIESARVKREEDRQQAEQEAKDAEVRQKEQNRILQELDRSITNAIHEREALDVEILRLSGVRDAMEISIDELTNRLEIRTTELRRRSNQIQEHADRLEKLSEAVQRLTSRESEMRRTSSNAIDREIAVLPAGEGILRGLHGPHFANSPVVRSTEDIFEG